VLKLLCEYRLPGPSTRRASTFGSHLDHHPILLELTEIASVSSRANTPARPSNAYPNLAMVRLQGGLNHLKVRLATRFGYSAQERARPSSLPVSCPMCAEPRVAPNNTFSFL
jgi:hypothetical protein